MNTENLTPASIRAIEDGGTNNAVIGGALVKRGIMVKQADMSRAIIEFRYVLSTEYLNWETSLNASPHNVETGTDGFPISAHAAGTSLANAIELPARDEVDANEEKKYADAIEAEEADADKDAPAFEAWQAKTWDEDEKNREIDYLRTEFADADDDRQEEIRIRLAQLGTVVYPQGTPEHDEYTRKLRAALDDFAKGNDDAFPDPELDKAVRQDEIAAKRVIHSGSERPPVRDFRETRYGHIERWTDENLEVKLGIVRQRLARRGLLKADRMQAERHLATITGEMSARGLTY